MSFQQTRIVITGVGLTAPNGNSLSEFRQNLLNGVAGVEPFDVRYMGRLIAGVCHFDTLRYQTRKGLRVGTRAVRRIRRRGSGIGLRQRRRVRGVHVSDAAREAEARELEDASGREVEVLRAEVAVDNGGFALVEVVDGA
jgi:hypothetical protein